MAPFQLKSAARARAAHAARVAARDQALRVHLAPLLVAGLSFRQIARTLDALRVEPAMARARNTRKWDASVVRLTCIRLGIYSPPQRRAA